MLRASLQASPPSARIHDALGSTPHSFSSSDSQTPVHSLQLVKPCARCTLTSPGPCHSLELLPEHSRKKIRDTDGSRFRSATVKTVGRCTRPCSVSVCVSGFRSG